MNEERGENSVTLGGAEYVLRPTFEAICQIERKAQKSMLALTQAAVERNITWEDVAIILTEGIKASGDPVAQKYQTEKIGMLAYEAGMFSVLPAIHVFCMNALTGGEKLSKKTQAATSE